MVTIGGAESAPPRGKEDILKAVGIRVKQLVETLSIETLVFFSVGKKLPVPSMSGTDHQWHPPD